MNNQNNNSLSEEPVPSGVPEPPPSSISMEDVGTRYEHLKRYHDDIVSILDILSKQRPTNEVKLKMAKFMVALQVLDVTLDAHTGYSNKETHFSLYKLIESVPKKAEEIPSERGTPLK